MHEDRYRMGDGPHAWHEPVTVGFGSTSASLSLSMYRTSLKVRASSPCRNANTKTEENTALPKSQYLSSDESKATPNQIQTSHWFLTPGSPPR